MSMVSKSFDRPDETRPFAANGHADFVMVAGRPVSRGIFEPGWRWSKDVGPIVKTEWCQTSHLGYVLSGRMRITMDDGTSQELGPGDVFALEPGHDAEVLGDEACVSLDFGEISDYARPA
jgi:hypothetical protein